MKRRIVIGLALLCSAGVNAQEDQAKSVSAVTGEQLAIAQGHAMLNQIEAANAKKLEEIRAASGSSTPASVSVIGQAPSVPVAPPIVGTFREEGETRVAVAIGSSGRVFLAAGETTPDGEWIVQDANGRVRLVPAKAAARRSQK